MLIKSYTKISYIFTVYYTDLKMKATSVNSGPSFPSFTIFFTLSTTFISYDHDQTIEKVTEGTHS